MLALATSDLEPTQREMADFLSLDPSQIVALVDELESRGLLCRSPGKRDRRAKIVTATPEGARLFAAAQPAAREAERLVLAALQPQEASALKELLCKALWEK
ncbi:MarR family transcriptional regulator [Arthrobacter sp. efr-133-TYG-120]|uniref:MarR family winged helix-turn-helix transcriptional regulator n=1 Tax=Arthrobacter sp. efr-133-TYG-120 TaxID=3040280 RepID=UPI00254AA779|nr:MarR family transcriptional regulator [Arthrobacter sp. efr-133-TYG-120]